jgi:hypothetical protein
MNKHKYSIEPIGTIRSKLTDIEQAPLQGDEGAPGAWLELTVPVAQGLVGITAGDELIVRGFTAHNGMSFRCTHGESLRAVDGHVCDAVAGSSRPGGTSSGFGLGGRRASVKGCANEGDRWDTDYRY